ncbi:hypothetical protein [Methylobacterium goesingense]|uniref:Arc-like DNA binding domain-containing protein n=1 Tax=Methylobacterium goesingense TaxID=243690 RepID=A0ABV2LCM6_9HYPH|nr:hypothetical protein [Methylobacterium goesingense]GJD73596.1 hypothetical protein CFIICLFH_1825 [Methylobacterium goesingense]
MTNDSGTPKRRGRPPAPEEKKRRHNLTFRIRGDLKEEIERRATSNGRSISEEMEFIIEKSLPIFDENANAFISDIRPLLGIHMKDKFNSVSKESYQRDIKIDYLTSKDDSRSYSSNKLTDSHRNMDKSYKELALFHESSRDTSIAAHVSDKNYGSNEDIDQISYEKSNNARESAIKMAESFIEASRKGIVEALNSILSNNSIENPHDNSDTDRVIDMSIIQRIDDAKAKYDVSAELDRLRAEVDALKSGGQKLAGAPNAQVAQDETTRQEYPDFSIAELIVLISRLTAPSPDLNVLWSSSWPHRFADLPAETRAALVGKFKGRASALYEDMMRPKSSNGSGRPSMRSSPQDISHGLQVRALQRMQNALLPRDKNEDEGFDDYEE